MIYRATDVIGLDVHGKDGHMGWVEEVFFSSDHSVRAVLIDLRRGIATGWKLLVGSSWIESMDPQERRLELFLDRADVRRAEPHDGGDVPAGILALLPPEGARELAFAR